MKVLITGGAGFIGGHLAEHFVRSGSDVVVLDSLRSGHRANVPAGARLVEGSVTDRELVGQVTEGVECVFHLAALVSVPESLERPHECVDINVHGLLNVIEAARRSGCRKLVFSSSAAVYGDRPEPRLREELPPGPRTPYGISKLDGEFYLAMAAEQWGLSTVSLRYFNVFGPGQDPASPYAAAIPIFLERARKGQDITLFGDGLQTRDFIFVSDVVAANVLAATTPMTGVFNVARGEAVSILDLARRIVDLSGSCSRILHGPERPGDIRHSLADISRIRACGFAPATDLTEGIRRILDLERSGQVCSGKGAGS